VIGLLLLNAELAGFGSVPTLTPRSNRQIQPTHIHTHLRRQGQGRDREQDEKGLKETRNQCRKGGKEQVKPFPCAPGQQCVGGDDNRNRSNALGETNGGKWRLGTRGLPVRQGNRQEGRERERERDEMGLNAIGKCVFGREE
jgi:hypothetical protein